MRRISQAMTPLEQSAGCNKIPEKEAAVSVGEATAQLRRSALRRLSPPDRSA
jgi:hypothetical protein